MDRPPSSGPALGIVMAGTRGVPARYGGFETAVEEIGRRLAQRGHRVVVYCRRDPTSSGARDAPYLGMDRRTVPAVRRKSLETISSTLVSAADLLVQPRPDVILLFNAGNAVVIPLLRRRNTPVAVHVDGLEWKRDKWEGAGRHFYRLSESLAVRWADALIADAAGIADYYSAEFGARTELLAYGAPILHDADTDLLRGLDLRSGDFHLVVARFEPENHVEEIVVGYRRSRATKPLVVVGDAPYGAAYRAKIEAAAHGDTRVRLLGSVWDQRLLDQLYAHALLYLHGHSVGGTNPSLLRAIGAGTAVAAWDVSFNREVLGDQGRYFSVPDQVQRVVEEGEEDPEACRERGGRLRDRAESLYDWERVTDGYEELAGRLASGWTRRGEVSGRRTEAK